MGKRVAMLLVVMGIMLPVTTFAWTLNTWVKSAGGFMQSPNLAGNQTSVNGSVTKSYTTSAPLTVTVTPNAGYGISNLTKNGIIQTLADPTATYTTTVAGPSNQSVQATFARTQYTLSAGAGANGAVSPASITPVYGGGQSPAKVFTYTPASGYSVLAVSVPGHLLNSDYQLLDAATNAPVTLPAAPNVRVKVSIVNVNGSTALMGTFGVVGANAGPAQTVLAGAPVVLDGSASTGASSYAWSQVSGPSTVTLAGATTNRASFTAPAVLGNYVFRLTINGGSSSTTTVQVTDNYAQAARNQCENCHGSQGVGPGAYGNWSTSVHKNSAVMCYKCHVGTTTGGHPGTVTDRTVDRNTFTLIGPANGGAVGSSFCAQCHGSATQIVTDYNASPHRQKPNGPATCSACHGNAHAVVATVNPCVACHVDFSGNVPNHGLGSGANRCTLCHNPHSTTASGCDGCHECPPATASHVKHFSGTVVQAGYGDTRIARDINPAAAGYLMNCGNCHPLDSARHMNGAVDVELANPLAPAGSVKALNPASAAYAAGSELFTDSRGFRYTQGTCSNVYCHSYTDWTTPGGVPLARDCRPESSSYWPQNLVISRIYRNVTWGGGALSCSGCHANPPRTAYPANDGGAGNSHSWIDSYGYENLHSWNMGFDPVSCKDCHNDTVKQPNTFTRDDMDVATLSEVPISSHAKHVNGINDVSFDTQNPFAYQTYGGATNMSLATATYDASTKTCQNVSCHFNQTSVKWGTPYRWFDMSYECDRCHWMGACN